MRQRLAASCATTARLRRCAAARFLRPSSFARRASSAAVAVGSVSTADAFVEYEDDNGFAFDEFGACDDDDNDDDEDEEDEEEALLLPKELDEPVAEADKEDDDLELHRSLEQSSHHHSTGSSGMRSPTEMK